MCDDCCTGAGETEFCRERRKEFSGSDIQRDAAEAPLRLVGALRVARSQDRLTAVCGSGRAHGAQQVGQAGAEVPLPTEGVGIQREEKMADPASLPGLALADLRQLPVQR